ncbi:MAG TPA: hypothetical protein VFW40_14280, partial [Capsulimonadaceae bacterium]|nr:hypothetical protein [Capsulimonadaceae bacterium]
MSEEDRRAPSWPPAPVETPDIPQYDEILDRARAALKPSRAAGLRFGLITALRREASLPAKEGVKIVDDYCDRNGIVFTKPSVWEQRSSLALAVLALIQCAMSVILLCRENGMFGTPHTIYERAIWHSQNLDI